MMTNKSIKNNTKFRQTDKKRSIIIGVLLSILLTATPFLFYIYQFAPADSKEWETSFGTIRANGFNSVQSFMHAVFTKATFVLLLGIWFLTARNWWKYAILIPLTMFLFQFVGVLNVELAYIDEYDFWYSLPIITPIILFLIFISIRLSSKQDISASLKREVDDEIQKMLSDDL
ncbi:hypothetical protein [Jejudonia soesokkakensis]|uniref:hypothetical protein n=1 Tax=Jejudonia soesokkakensis TaxID=1323432 RepID=UPI0036D29F20